MTVAGVSKLARGIEDVVADDQRQIVGIAIFRPNVRNALDPRQHARRDQAELQIVKRRIHATATAARYVSGREVDAVVVIPHRAHRLRPIERPSLATADPRDDVGKVVVAALPRRDEEVRMAVGVGRPVPTVHVKRHLLREVVYHPHNRRLPGAEVEQWGETGGEQRPVGLLADIAPEVRERELHRARQELIRPRHVVHLVILHREAIPVRGVVKPLRRHTMEHTADRRGVLGRERAGRHRGEPRRKDDRIDPARDLVVLEGVGDRSQIDRQRRIGKFQRGELGDSGGGMDGRGTDDGSRGGRPLHERATTGATSPAGRRSTTGTRHGNPSRGEDPFELCRRDGS